MMTSLLIFYDLCLPHVQTTAGHEKNIPQKQRGVEMENKTSLQVLKQSGVMFALWAMISRFESTLCRFRSLSDWEEVPSVGQ